MTNEPVRLLYRPMHLDVLFTAVVLAYVPQHPRGSGLKCPNIAGVDKILTNSITTK